MKNTSNIINTGEKIIFSGAAKDSWKTAGKFALTQLVESGAKEALNFGVDHLCETGLKFF